MSRIMDNGIYCLIYAIKGEFNIKVADDYYHIKPMEFLLLKPNVFHCGVSITNTDVEYYWMHIITTEKNALFDGMKLESNIAYLPNTFKPADFDRLAVMLNQLSDMYSIKYYTENILLSLVKTIIYETSDQYINYINKKKHDKKFEKLINWLDLNYYKNFSLEELAIRFNYSKTYLSAKFKKITNKTVLEYIHDKRIEKSKFYLCDTKDTIKELAFAVGFNDEKYFMRIFKSKVHMTPTEFRNSNSQYTLNDS